MIPDHMIKENSTPDPAPSLGLMNGLSPLPASESLSPSDQENTQTSSSYGIANVMTDTGSESDRTISNESCGVARETKTASDLDFTPLDSVKLEESNPWEDFNHIEVAVPETTLLAPRSHFDPFDPPAPERKERQALDILVPIAKQQCGKDDDFIDLQVDEFAIYSDKAHYYVEMRPLHQLDTGWGNDVFFMDGVVSVGDMRCFVRGVPITSMPIGNYGTSEEHTVRDNIWLSSSLTSQRDVYYRLGTPAKEYRRFFRPFLWVADLAKHFVDYLKAMAEIGESVTIFRFRSAFAAWLEGVHGHNPAFVKWRKQYPRQDFRTSVVANLWFLHKEATGVLSKKEFSCHMLWDEILTFERYKQPPKTANLVDDLSTVVTPYIYDCFEHLPFGDRLTSMPLSVATEKLRTHTIQNRHLQLPTGMRTGHKELSTVTRDRIETIKAGDTISTHRDSEESGTKWKREVSKGFSDVDRWFALVQKVHINRRGKRSFDVTWYYRPVDTICGLMKYPWNNELFISDHCSCGHDTKITEEEVIGIHQVDFGGSPTTSAELFCRQVYIHEERKWVTLDADHHLRCEHVQPLSSDAEYRPGDTLLIYLNRKSGRSEPCELVSKEYDEAGRLSLLVRHLLRRRDLDGSKSKARPDELVYTELTVKVRPSSVMDRCHVRFFKHGEPISTPYDRDGVGNCFYITHRLGTTPDGQPSLEPVLEPPNSLHQGFDPDARIPKLRGLDLFCGGGNFGRGLEEGGAIEMNWANDYATKALHTYMANAASPDRVHPFLGSIDILHSLAIQGKFSESVPKPGDVDFISGGSPCPGFSRLTNDKTTVQQRKNQSLVAAFASFVDLYRPKYGLLENVPGIVQNRTGRDQDVFSQLVCAVVGLGYQTQFYFLDASACGSPQRRSRVFLVFAAPGCKLPQKPCQTHSHPEGTRSLSLGRLPNEESMAEREMKSATPFKFVTAAEATADLPRIYDGKPDICIPHPDHRVCIGTTKMVRMEWYHIPNHPFGMNFARAWYGMDRTKPVPGSGVMTQSERGFYPAGTNSSVNCVGPNSSAYGRQHPHRLIETIVTKQGPRDAKSGRQLHWREDRTLTLLEARRAQGFRDHEVLLGNKPEQYKIVGNSVAREVAVALGVAFREAWAETLAKQGPKSFSAADLAAEDATMIADSGDTSSAASLFANSDISQLDGPVAGATTPPTITEACTSEDELRVISDVPVRSHRTSSHRSKRPPNQHQISSDIVMTAIKKRRM